MSELFLKDKEIFMLKKNKYIEIFDNVVAEAKYSVADQVHKAVDLVDRVMTVIATDLEMTKYNTDVNIRHPLGRFLVRYVSIAKRMCIDVFISGLPRNNIFFSGIQVDPTEMKISVVVRKINDDAFIDTANMFNIFDNEGVSVTTKLFAASIKVETTAIANKDNIKALRAFIAELVKYLELDDTVVLTLKDYNYLLRLIAHLQNELDDLKKQFNEGSVKIKRDKTIDNNINNAINGTTEVGFSDVKKAAKIVQGEMITVGWVLVENKVDSDTQIRMSFLDAKVHPTMMYISVSDKEVKFYLAKFATPVDEVTGHQKVEYDLLHIATNIADVKAFIHTNLCQ